MRIGVPKELKDQEYRVGLTPASVHALCDAGHDLLVEEGAGLGSGIPDHDYRAAGARIEPSTDRLFAESRMIVKVKEPIEQEWDRLQEGQILFAYLHLAPLPDLTDALLDRKVTAVAYETIADGEGNLPLLMPMSEIAGRMAVLVGSYYLQRGFGGRGTLLSGVPGVPPGDVVILGGGIVGLNAAKIALGMGARVAVLDTNQNRLRFLDNLFHGAVTTLTSNHHNLVAALRRADLLIGAVLIPGSSAPKIVSRKDLGEMKYRSVLVDVAVDQGGCVETTRPTTHSNPVFEVEGVLHYCVTNMPGSVPRTATFALNNVTLPYAMKLASKGLAEAVAEDAGLAQGVNTYQGRLTCAPVAQAQERELTELASVLG